MWVTGSQVSDVGLTGLGKGPSGDSWVVGFFKLTPPSMLHLLLRGAVTMTFRVVVTTPSEEEAQEATRLTWTRR